MCLWAPSKDLMTQEQRIRCGGSGEGAPQSKVRRREQAGHERRYDLLLGMEEVVCAWPSAPTSPSASSLPASPLALPTAQPGSRRLCSPALIPILQAAAGYPLALPWGPRLSLSLWISQVSYPVTTENSIQL